MDSSRVSTFFISILLIVYGSFRSIAMEEGKSGTEEGEDEKRREQNVTTLDSLQETIFILKFGVYVKI